MLVLGLRGERLLLAAEARHGRARRQSRGTVLGTAPMVVAERGHPGARPRVAIPELALIPAFCFGRYTSEIVWSVVCLEQ